LNEGISSEAKIERFIDDRNAFFCGKTDDIRSPPKFRTHDIGAMKADQTRNKKMIHFPLQMDCMRDQKFHGKTTILEIDNLLFFRSIRNNHPPTQFFEKGVPKGKITIKH